MKKSAAPIKSNKNAIVSVNDEIDGIDELYRPFLIHSTTTLLLTDQTLLLLPFQRNVVLTMNEYDLSDINPMHPKTDDSPTHIIIFCVRFIACNTFQPIGGLLIYKHEDQSALLAECLKAFINDIWKLGLYVVATISPPVETFKGILRHVVDIKNFDTYSGVITYSVDPFKEIVHIYDIQFLLMKLQNLFKEGDIRFKEGTREHLACWDDIATVISSSPELKILSSFLLQNNVSRRVHIFSQQIFERYMEFEACGHLSKNAGGCAVLLDCVRSFLQFTELDFVDLVIMCKGQSVWETFTAILQSMVFQKSNKRTCTKEMPTKIQTIITTSARRKIDFDVDDYLDIEGLVQNVTDNLLIKAQEEYFEMNRLENLGIDPAIINQKKGKKKKGLNEASSTNNAQTDADQSIGRLGNKFKLKKQPKPYEKHNGKVSNIEKLDNTTVDTSIKKEKTDHVNGSIQNSKSYEKPKEIFLENKPYCKTDNFYKNVNSDSNKSGPNKFDNNVNTNCDKNNCSEVNLDVNKKENSTTAKNNCDSKIKKKQAKKNIEEANFDVVLNDPQIFFKNFCLNNPNASNNQLETKSSNSKESQNFTENDKKKYFKDDTQGTSGKSSNINVNVSKDKTPNDNEKSLDTCLNDFSSPSDEETENSINETCDNIPNIIQLLSNVPDKEKPPDEFEKNTLTDEMLCTVTGMKKLMENLIKRRVKIAKPDAFIVEHIDFLVSMIKRDKNNITSVHYYGHTYSLLNNDLAFDTLQNNKGLYLVSK